MSQLIKDLIAHRKSYIDCNPIFARLAGGDLTRFHYLAYLRETYHLIKHTPKYLTIAANRVAENDERLANYFRNFSREEAGHELLCIRDIHALGENADDILSGDPNPGVWGMVTQCYFWASQGNPIALLGDAFATEELGVARSLEQQSFLRRTIAFHAKQLIFCGFTEAKTKSILKRRPGQSSGMQEIAVSSLT